MSTPKVVASRRAQRAPEPAVEAPAATPLSIWVQYPELGSDWHRTSGDYADFDVALDEAKAPTERLPGATLIRIDRGDAAEWLGVADLHGVVREAPPAPVAALGRQSSRWYDEWYGRPSTAFLMLRQCVMLDPRLIACAALACAREVLPSVVGPADLHLRLIEAAEAWCIEPTRSNAAAVRSCRRAAEAAGATGAMRSVLLASESGPGCRDGGVSSTFASLAANEVAIASWRAADPATGRPAGSAWVRPLLTGAVRRFIGLGTVLLSLLDAESVAPPDPTPERARRRR